MGGFDRGRGNRLLQSSAFTNWPPLPLEVTAEELSFSTHCSLEACSVVRYNVGVLLTAQRFDLRCAECLSRSFVIDWVNRSCPRTIRSGYPLGWKTDQVDFLIRMKSGAARELDKFHIRSCSLSGILHPIERKSRPKSWNERTNGYCCGWSRCRWKSLLPRCRED